MLRALLVTIAVVHVHAENLPMTRKEAVAMLYNEYVAIGGSAESEHGKIIGKIVAGHGAPLPHPPHEAKNEPRFRREGHVSDGEGGAEANGPRIGTADGNIVIQTGGQHVSVKIGAADPVIIDELPVVVHSYTDQALRQFALGFSTARKHHDNGVPALISHINTTVEEDVLANIEQVNAIYTATASHCLNRLQEISARVETIEDFSFTTSTTATTTTITVTTTTVPDNGQSQAAAGLTCKTILDNHPKSENAKYWISPATGKPKDAFRAFCDMKNGGWTYKAENEWFTLTYTKGVQKITTPNVDDTKFHFKLYGAAGGKSYNNERQPGGTGGFAAGIKSFDAGTDLFIMVGGQGGMGHREDVDGDSSRYNFKGFNGGGQGTRGGSGGGGCTDVRLSASGLQSRLIVAGGGGGCGSGQCDKRGGHGGGLSGEQASDGQAYGGTQSAGGRNNCNCGQAYGTFGRGGDFCDQNDSGGGGCGWYGGSASCSSNRPGAGGSSYFGKMDSGTRTDTAGGSSKNGRAEFIYQ